MNVCVCERLSASIYQAYYRLGASCYVCRCHPPGSVVTKSEWMDVFKVICHDTVRCLSTYPAVTVRLKCKCDEYRNEYGSGQIRSKTSDSFRIRYFPPRLFLGKYVGCMKQYISIPGKQLIPLALNGHDRYIFLLCVLI